MGAVLGDLNARRGTVSGTEARGEMQIVTANVPLANMFGYATAVRSLTKGRAGYSMEPDKFAIAPQSVRAHLESM